MLVSLLACAKLVTDPGDTSSPAACTPLDEVCDGVDNDCDGIVDAGATDAPTWYRDLDADGYGGDVAAIACDAPPGAIATGGDCADDAADRFPGAAEHCNGDDDDCDNLVDGDDSDLDPNELVTSYVDADADGWGAGIPVRGCTVASGAVSDDGDCDDLDAAVHPDAEDVCFDDVDQNCDGSEEPCTYPETVEVDSTFPTVWAESAGAFAGGVTEVADIDGDGADDLLVGAPSGGTNYQGKAYIVRGPFSGASSLADAETTFVGEPWAQWGCSVHGGDLSGDGTTDWLVGSNTTYMAAFEGPVGPGEIGFDDADWVFAADETVGRYLHTTDVSGDGRLDLLVGDPFAGSNEAGAAYYFYGPITGDLTSAEADVTWTGTTFLGSFGFDVLVIGDVDGDGIDDIGVGAPSAWSATDSEALYVVSGADAGGSVEDGMAALVGPAGQVESCGQTPVGEDMNGDGYQDVIVGCPWAYGGVGYLAFAFGPVVGTNPIADLADRIEGYGPDTLGDTIQAGDFDHDTVPDLLLGESGANAVVLAAGPFSGTVSANDVVTQTWEGADSGSAIGFAIAPLVNAGVSSWAFGSGSMDVGSFDVPAVYVVPAL